MPTTQARTVADVIEHYMDRRGRMQGTTVSTRQAIATIRMIVRECGLSDRELADMIAASAIRRGCGVSFDTGGEGLQADAQA